MNTRLLTPGEAAELDFLRWLDVSLAAYCGETTDFRARKIAADFGAKHLERLRAIEAKLDSKQAVLDFADSPGVMAAEEPTTGGKS